MTAQNRPSNTDVVQAQLEAYNAQDLDAYCAFFAEGVTVADLNGAVTTQSLEAYRARYAGVFAQFPQNRADILSSYMLGETVVLHETVARAPDGDKFEVMSIYTFEGDKVSRVEFIR